MSNEGAKRLSLSLTLNPALSDADRYAIRALKRWYQQAKASQEHEPELQATVRKFHRDVYLSGLFMHLLHPGLASNLANVTTEGQITLATLCHQLNSLGFGLQESAETENEPDPGISALLSQLEQLTSLVQSQQHQLKHLSRPADKSVSSVQPHIETKKNNDGMPDATVLAQVKKIKQKGLF